MTYQEAAYEILREAMIPLPLNEISDIAINENIVKPKAKDPKDSFKKTIHSNITRGKTKGPKLIYINTPEGKKVSLPEWES